MKNAFSIIIVFLLFPYGYCLNAQKLIFGDSILADVEIVLLGEQTHGDGAVFEKKLAMIKELHEDKGFNLLVFESGLYDNFKANQLYSNKRENAEIYKKSIGWLYSNTKAFKELLDYQETHPKLKILGFDSQESYLFEEFFLEDFNKFCVKNGILFSDETRTALEKVFVARDIEGYKNNKKDSTALYNRIETLKNNLNAIPKTDLETKVLIQTFKSVFSDMDFNLKMLQKEKICVQNPRDKQMAANMIFLRNLFPNEKIIGWGASYHFANRINEFTYTQETENHAKKSISLRDSLGNHNHSNLNEELRQIKDLQFAVPMGQILKKKYGNKLFSLAFTSFEGAYFDFSIDKVLPILTMPSNSLENTLKEKKLDNHLVVLESTPSEFYTAVLGYLPIYANWENIFDGIFYIEKMFPPVYLDYKEGNTELETLKNNVNKVRGVVLNKETSEEISYADIYFANSNVSTVSNAEGKFGISISKNKNDYLIFSAIGYDSDSVRVSNLEAYNTITLTRIKDDISLNEVTVTGKRKTLTPEEILKRAKRNIENNYVQIPYNQSFFFKIKEGSLKDSTNYGEEAFISTFNKKGINGSNTPEINFYGKIEHLRNNTDKYDKHRFNNGVGSLWVVLNKDIVLSKSNVLYRTSSYDLKNEGVTSYEGKKVYQISFSNNSPGAYSTGYGYPAPESSKGTIFIDSEKYAVVKYEHYVQRASFTSKKTKNNISQSHHIVQSYKKVNDTYFINLFEITNKTKVYSPQNEFLNAYTKVSKLVSHNIETKNVIVFPRPITELKKGFSEIKEDSFWDNIPSNYSVDIKTD